MKWDSSHFDDWAGDYDESIEPFIKQFPFIGYYELLAAVQSLARPVAGMKIVDVGIGTGLLSAELAKEGGLIYGVDFSQKMLTKAAKRVPGARLTLADIARDHLGEFNGEKFDRIVSSYVLHHLTLEQKVAFIVRAASENLNPGGRIIIGDIGFETQADHDAARERWKDQWDFDEYYLRGDETVQALANTGLKLFYKQTSKCAGVLLYCN